MQTTRDDVKNPTCAVRVSVCAHLNSPRTALISYQREIRRRLMANAGAPGVRRLLLVLSCCRAALGGERPITSNIPILLLSPIPTKLRGICCCVRH
jgi:hypothetical protein